MIVNPWNVPVTHDDPSTGIKTPLSLSILQVEILSASPVSTFFQIMLMKKRDCMPDGDVFFKTS
ncbi:MAG TPA: hypothetical protein PLV50_03305 [Smithella sp.]|nr:hypothetical protein [Smithella sp.]HNY50143.1 hypothetical protein [Smithella sp.]HOG89540.1 hypothetical protein [Smithella sp.]HOU49876.1 hypothetical protein [Smithella sp.]HQH15600.1 hypothetical protein [Smithella sp.]